MTFETRIKEVQGFFTVEVGKVDEVIDLYMPYATLNEVFMFKQEAEFAASMFSSMITDEINSRMTMEDEVLSEIAERESYEGLSYDEVMYLEVQSIM